MGNEKLYYNIHGDTEIMLVLVWCFGFDFTVIQRIAAKFLSFEVSKE